MTDGQIRVIKTSRHKTCNELLLLLLLLLAHMCINRAVNYRSRSRPIKSASGLYTLNLYLFLPQWASALMTFFFLSIVLHCRSHLIDSRACNWHGFFSPSECKKVPHQFNAVITFRELRNHNNFVTARTFSRGPSSFCQKRKR